MLYVLLVSITGPPWLIRSPEPATPGPAWPIGGTKPPVVRIGGEGAAACADWSWDDASTAANAANKRKTPAARGVTERANFVSMPFLRRGTGPQRSRKDARNHPPRPKVLLPGRNVTP